MSRTKFIVDDPMTRNAVHVLSRAPLETILVRTNDVRGEIEVNPDDVTDRPRVVFEAPVESLDSGVPLMNDVMRSDRWLDAAKTPAVRFTLGRVLSPAAPTPLADGKPIVLTAEGTLELRGASRPVAVRAEVTWMRGNESTARRLPGDLLHVVARFDVHLAAFGIESHLSAQTLDKVAGAIPVEADLFGSTVAPQVPADMRDRLAQAKKNLGQRLIGA
ncbi:MAG TPA: YceI family protein [Solirubrobacteraceae bacterium]|jgi:polyisoprenoid-binding protein YceI